MLHTASGPGYGASCLHSPQQPHPYCASSCVYIWRMLNRRHPLFLSRRRPFGPTQKLYTRSGRPPSLSCARRKLVVARGYVTQETTEKEAELQEESEGDGVNTCNIPANLPWTVNPSLAVQSWGSIYHGSQESKYFNTKKDFPYPVGYSSIKIYKEKEYCQSIEEGPEGPVFVVKEASLGVFRSASPQKVWNKVCEQDKICVHGMRHFGFENSAVISVLRAMVSQSRNSRRRSCELKKSHGDHTDSSIVNSLAEEVNEQNSLNKATFAGGSEEVENVVNISTSDDVDYDDNDEEEEEEEEEEDISLLDSADDDDADIFDIGNTDNSQYVEGNVTINARNDDDYNDNDADDVLDDSEDESDFEEEDKRVNHHLSLNVFADERMSSSEVPTTSSSTGRLSTKSKRSFKSGPRKVTFARVSKGPDDFVKHDYTTEGSKDESQMTNNPVYPTPYTSRQKAIPTAERQVWRKGEGLTGFVPGHGKQQGTEKARADEQGEGLTGITGIAPGYYRQQAAERVRAGEQGEGLLHDVSGHYKQHATERVRVGEQENDSSSFSSFNSANAVKSWEGSISKRKEEHPKNSSMLLELLDKWNKVKKWDHESGNRLQGKHSKKQEENVDSRELNLGDGRLSSSLMKKKLASKSDTNLESSKSSAFSMRSGTILAKESPQTRSVNDDESVFDDLWNPGNIDESTNFAVSKLFEAEGKPSVLLDDGKTQARHWNSTSNDSKLSHSGAGSSNTEMGGMASSFLVADSVNGLKTTVQEGVRIKKPSEVNCRISKAGEKTRHEPSIVATRVELPVDVPQRGADEVRLIEEVRKLIINNKFEDALLKVRGLKLFGMTIDEDVYEAVLGFKLDPWQKEVFRQVQDGSSVLVSAPGGAGKSAVADCCIYNNVVNEQRTLFITPYERLAQQNLHRFETMFGQGNVGGIWTRKRMQTSPKLVVITLEMLSSILHELNGPGGSEFRFFFEGVNMVVLDKFCTFGEANHGNLWEEILMLMDLKIRVIALTLPAANEAQIASWISMHRGPCKLVSCTSEPTPKRYLFCHKAGLFPLLDPKGLQVNSDLLQIQKLNGLSVTNDHLESTLRSGYDKLSLMYMLNALEANVMLPALVVFLDVKSCDNAMQEALSDKTDGFLSRAEIDTLETLFSDLGEEHSDLWNHINKADYEGLRKGFAVYHEGKMPLWQNFVLKLYQENLVKVLIATESRLLHSEFMARTVIFPAICKVTNNGVSSIAHGQFLQLIGRAGRRGYDVEGNVVFLNSIYSGPQEAVSLLLQNTLRFSSCFKPSYSLVVNLLAKHKIAEVKRILSRSFADFQFFTECTKAEKLKELDQEIFNCLEGKASLDSNLFEGLAQINKHKLLDAAMFTRVDIRMSIHSMSQSGNGLPGILLAVVSGQTESFYMIFGADNNFHLLPAGALDHVYINEVPPLDVVFKQSTGQALQPPLVPPKEKWTVDDDGSFGYIASGSSQTMEYVRLMLQYPVQPTFAREGLQLRKDILALEAQVSNLIEKRKRLQTETVSSDLKTFQVVAAGWQMDESETWKETLRLLKILEKVDALSIIDKPGAYVKLKPLGMLISRLHDVENELWLAMVVTSKYVKPFLPAEFSGLMATLTPLEPEVESLFADQRDLSYKVTKSAKDAFAGLEVLRKQIAALQGSYSPPLQFETAFSGLVYAWARGKRDTNGCYVMSANDGDIAWKLRSVVRLTNSVYRACTQVSMDISEPNNFNSLSSLAKRAKDMLSKHLTAIDRT